MSAFVPCTLLRWGDSKDCLRRRTNVAQAKNERNTENLVRDALRKLDYYETSNSISVEEQKSVIESVKKLLRTSSKSAGEQAT